MAQLRELYESDTPMWIEERDQIQTLDTLYPLYTCYYVFLQMLKGPNKPTFTQLPLTTMSNIESLLL